MLTNDNFLLRNFVPEVHVYQEYLNYKNNFRKLIKTFNATIHFNSLKVFQ